MLAVVAWPPQLLDVADGLPPDVLVPADVRQPRPRLEDFVGPALVAEGLARLVGRDLGLVRRRQPPCAGPEAAAVAALAVVAPPLERPSVDVACVAAG